MSEQEEFLIVIKYALQQCADVLTICGAVQTAEIAEDAIEKVNAAIEKLGRAG